MNIEKSILKNLLTNDSYTRKVMPFLKDEYFAADEDKVLFSTIHDFMIKYNQQPTPDVLEIDITNRRDLREDTLKSVIKTVKELFLDAETTNEEWLVDSTEKFCQERAVYLAIMKSIDIMDNKNSPQSRGAIPQLLSDALGVSFNSDVGHEYFEQADKRYEHYHRKEEKIPFDIEFFNTITKGGVQKKTFNVILAGTGAGKSLLMCHLAASYLSQGKNVLYITAELSDIEVSKRIDANLLNLDFDDLQALPKDIFLKKVEARKNASHGKLFVKEYPTASASVVHFRALVDELKLKKRFVADVLIIDYINICTSSRIKMGGSVNSYTYIKSVAEEFRGLAVELNIPVWSATQVNRAGFNSSDVGLENTSESFGLPAVADFMFALIVTEELEKLGQIMVKQLKSRYNDLNRNKRFIIGVDKSKMKVYDVSPSAQVGLTGSGQTVAGTIVGSQFSSNKPVNKFQSLKV